MLENQCYAGNEFACMAGTPANLSVLRFSTDELPERERLPAFQKVFGRAIAKADVEPVAGTHLRIQATVRAMPGLGAWIGAFSPIQGRRTRELIADGNDNVTLWMCPEGGSVISQCGREVTHNGDDAMLVSNSDMLSTTMVRRSRHVSLSLPRKVMLTMVPDLEDAFLRSVPKDSEPLRATFACSRRISVWQRLSCATSSSAMCTTWPRSRSARAEMWQGLRKAVACVPHGCARSKRMSCRRSATMA